MTFKSNFKRWASDVLYKRVRESNEAILTNQIQKGAEKYRDPLPGDWTAKQLIRHAKEEKTDLEVYLEATEMVIERMETEIDDLKRMLSDERKRANLAEKQLADALIAADRDRRKWANRGR